MENKMTKVQSLTAIRDLLTAQGVDTYTEFLDHEIALLVKRSENRKPSQSKTTKENAEVREKLFDAIAMAETPVSSADLSALTGLSVNKVAGLLRGLVTDGRIKTTKDKKRTLYSLS